MNAAATSVVVPAFNEEASIGPLVSGLRAAAAWGEILVVDDGSQDETAERARTAGARVIRHPYNKGNGAAVKTGVRNATGLFILIIDADGQHLPADALRLVAHLDAYDLVVGARSSQTQATAVRRYGNAMLNWTASYLTERPIPDLTSGFRAARLASGSAAHAHRIAGRSNRLNRRGRRRRGGDRVMISSPPRSPAFSGQCLLERSRRGR